MSKTKITGVRVYVLTVDSETDTVIKWEEEDPNTHERTELHPNFKVVPVGPTSTISTTQRDAHPPSPPPPPPGAVPPPPSSSEAAEHKKAHKGRPPKV